MKSTYGILWYFFIIYATSVIVNFSHYHKTFPNDANESVILSAARCLFNGRDINTGQNNCKLSFQYKKETVLYFLKNLLNRKEFNKFYKLTLKNGANKGKSDLVNITLDLKPLFGGKNSNSTDQLNFWYSFYIFASILLIAFVTPLWPLTNYIYIITLASMFVFSITVYLQLLKLLVFSIVYLITLKKYKFWLLPNLNKDVGLLSTFWPLYELNSPSNDRRLEEQNSPIEQTGDKPLERPHDQQVNKPPKSQCNNKLEIDLKRIQKQTVDNRTGLNKPDSTTSEIDLLVNDNETEDSPLNSTTPSTITEFTGNARLPTITTTPPPNCKFTFEPANRLEIVDLNNELDERSTDKQVNMIEGRKRTESYLVDYASITPAVSYLNVNEVRRRQHSPARQRIASNRSDDGFEILNHDFLKGSPPTKEDELFVCSKQDL